MAEWREDRRREYGAVSGIAPADQPLGILYAAVGPMGGGVTLERIDVTIAAITSTILFLGVRLCRRGDATEANFGSGERLFRPWDGSGGETWADFRALVGVGGMVFAPWWVERVLSGAGWWLVLKTRYGLGFQGAHGSVVVSARYWRESVIVFRDGVTGAEGVRLVGGGV